MRRTTSYMLNVFTDEPDKIADELLLACPVEIDASGVGRRRAFIRYRCNTEELAIIIARGIRGQKSFVLSCGYGIHYRVVLEQSESADGELLQAEQPTQVP